MSLLKILSIAQNRPLFIKLYYLLKKNPKYNSTFPSYFIQTIFIKFYNKTCGKYSGFLWKIHWILVGNNNTHSRNLPASSGNRNFCLFLLLLKKIIRFYILFIYFTEFYFLGCLYYKSATQIYF